MTNIEKNLQAVQKQIHDYALQYQRDPSSIKLLAASKGQDANKIKDALQAGQKSFGENYLQEALDKMALLKDEKIEWHFIGPIQNNKTKHIATHFDWAHCIESLKTAQRLNDQRPEHLPPLMICIQVNVSEETTKSGIHDYELLSLAEACSDLPRLKLRGLMTIPAPKNTFSEQRIEFHKLFLLQQQLIVKGFPLDILSMGMSHDLDAAIAEGSTLLRIGTAIFGEREKNKKNLK
ncbi:MAG: YggS family pyridoxal phosphate-dependent enzyme [Gammaproteobacteria bacterium]|nr:YggS family pyridoxal phosphate-dependent enzyme [Gammaproteobacteria bacterium]